MVVTKILRKSFRYGKKIGKKMKGALTIIRNMNYQSKLTRKLMKIRFVKKKLTMIMMIFLTIIIKLHISTLLSYLFHYNHWIDYGIEIICSVIVGLNHEFFYTYVTRYQHKLYQITRYFVNHYSEDNYNRWKTIVLGCASLYMIGILYLFEITSELLIIYIIQTLIICLIIDMIEMNHCQKWFRALKCRQTKPFQNFIMVQNDDFDKDYVIVN